MIFTSIVYVAKNIDLQVHWRAMSKRFSQHLSLEEGCVITYVELCDGVSFIRALLFWLHMGMSS